MNGFLLRAFHQYLRPSEVIVPETIVAQSLANYNIQHERYYQNIIQNDKSGATVFFSFLMKARRVEGRTDRRFTSLILFVFLEI